MKKLYSAFAISMIFCLNSFGQLKTDTIKPVRNFSIELLGNGFFYSFKYENRFFIQKLRYSIGISYLPYSLFNSAQHQQAFCVIPEVDYLVGNKAHKLELGAGLTYRYWVNDELPQYYEYYHRLFLNFRLGYRYERMESKNIYKAGFVFIYDLCVLDSKDLSFGPKRIKPWIGLSYGRKF